VAETLLGDVIARARKVAITGSSSFTPRARQGLDVVTWFHPR